MRHFSLTVIALVLTLCGNAFAQQGLLAQHNDKDDPCRRFKMRIMVPANVDDHTLPLKKFAGGIDSRMVWNPCGTDSQQIAILIFGGPASQRADPSNPNWLTSQSVKAGFEAIEPGKLLALPDSAFKFNWRRP